MYRSLVYFFSAVAILLVGVGDHADSSNGFNCLINVSGNCQTTIVATTCAETCTFSRPPNQNQAGVFRCVGANGQATWPAPSEVQLNSITAMLESDIGFCEEGPPLPPIHCAVSYTCSKNCNSMIANQICKKEDPGTGVGPQVVPHAVDPELPCPLTCEED